MRLKLGIVSETTQAFLNQVKLCLFSLRKNGGALSNIPVTLITNSDPLKSEERQFFEEHFYPIDFKISPRLGAIPHTSKLNVFYSIDPSSYDVLMFMDCDTVVRKPLDQIVDSFNNEDLDFVCRRGGESDRNSFVNFDELVSRYCGENRLRKIYFEGEEEWPMFNSGVFLGTSRAIRKIRRKSIEFTYLLFNEWQRTDALCRLPQSIKRIIEELDSSDYQVRPTILADWPIEQGALALSCIKARIKINYLDEVFNSWGGDEAFHVLHCFKSLYQFDRRLMFSEESEGWIKEYLESDVPGKVFLANTVRDYKNIFVT